VNKKKGSEAIVDMSEIRSGEAVKPLIIQVAALSWAITQVPEITAVPQSFLKGEFRSAAQVEFVAKIKDEDRHPLERRRRPWVSGILFVNAFFIRYCRSEDPRFGETHGSVAR
jgi:hypothetical protein